jgi:hypothetical protein
VSKESDPWPLIDYLDLHTLGLDFLWLVVLLSPTVLSHRTSLSIFMMLSLVCVKCWECWSSIHHDVRWPWWGSMLWFEQGLEWWERLWRLQFVVSLSRIRYGLVLRSRPPLGQHVSPHVRYETTCLLIRDVVGSVPCSNELEVAWSFARTRMVQEGPRYCVLPWEALAFVTPRISNLHD